MKLLDPVQVGEVQGQDWPRDEAGLLHGVCEKTVMIPSQGSRTNGAHMIRNTPRKCRAKFEHGVQVSKVYVPLDGVIMLVIDGPFETLQNPNSFVFQDGPCPI